MEKYVAPINDILKKLYKKEKEFLKNLTKSVEKSDQYVELSKNKRKKKDKTVYWTELKYSSDKTYQDYYDDMTVLRPPKSALLKMKDVKKLANMRKNKVYDDFIYVVEPQVYQKVTKLTPKSYMFESSNEFGYFTTGKSGVAHSGDGGDYGDKWWLANESLLKYLTKKYNTIKNEIDKLK
tara:strand:- start:5492 stop:6031 length:540 start_codon:yes stop_codon:yes gene_type:complete